MRIEVRRFEQRDREAVLALAPRLAEGVAAWRRPAAVRAAVLGWVTDALTRAHDPGRFVFVAEVRGEVAGFVAGEERDHWSGDIDLYVGELAVAARREGKGVGKALMKAVTQHARQIGVANVTLETGAANRGARKFYKALGFEPEDVRLTKTLADRPRPAKGANSRQ
ncbi:ribosomal protein S18 acetylase RimI-like enzyme [Kribbella amoyensis]|uniref:Ribosomal protein S18 acetylase RimI-like enzyme n=1 Tax=Kribbella amoyensis TaxID=996641 RepID=A0A561B0V9_9ACTN|nr:GNAT family N-acetyltransferase [Kribbella amoyensis]TWD72494.1 ribosomal protein S18 acetylase RimI-like enzyme [Kribbella amoyensis]